MACASCCAAGPGERGVRQLPCEDLLASDDLFEAAERPGDEAPGRAADGATPAKPLPWRAVLRRPLSQSV